MPSKSSDFQKTKKMITWAPLKPLTKDLLEPEVLSCFKEEINQVADKYWYYCRYRNCLILPLFTGCGKYRPEELHIKTNFDWTKAAEKTPTLRSVFERFLHDLFEISPRILVIKTSPMVKNPIHMDCLSTETNSLQLKMRLVVSGATDSLYFLNSYSVPQYIPSGYPLYVMDGGHPHGMNNRMSTKLTIAMGSPWNGMKSKPFDRVLAESLKTYPEQVIWREKIGRHILPDYFKRPVSNASSQNLRFKPQCQQIKSDSRRNDEGLLVAPRGGSNAADGLS